jgi:hypothetical protein
MVWFNNLCRSFDVYIEMIDLSLEESLALLVEAGLFLVLAEAGRLKRRSERSWFVLVTCLVWLSIPP